MTYPWVLWKDALAMIREHVDVSEGKSQALLKQACTSGEVRFSVEGNIASFASIPEFVWTHGGMGAEGRHWVEGPGRLLKFSLDDLRYWLDQLQKSETPIAEPQPTPPPAEEGPAPASKPGPKLGTLRRHEKSDRKRFPKLAKLMRDEKMSASAAAQKLGDQGLIDGTGTAASRAKRLAALYIKERKTTIR